MFGLRNKLRQQLPQYQRQKRELDPLEVTAVADVLRASPELVNLSVDQLERLRAAVIPIERTP